MPEFLLLLSVLSAWFDNVGPHLPVASMPGLIVLEAESRATTTNADGGGGPTTMDDAEASSGKALAFAADGARASYTFDVDRGGAWKLWLSARSADAQVSTADIGVSLDSTRLITIDDAKGLGLTWSWDTRYDNGRAALDLGTLKAGRHTLTIEVEDGDAAFDRFVLTQGNVRPGDARAVRADDFLDSIGVNLHLHFWDTVYGDFAKVQAALDDLGVEHVRDVASPFQTQLDRIEALAEQGYKFDFLIGGNIGTIEDQLARIGGVADATVIIEGANESDHSGIYDALGYGLFPDGTRAIQQEIHARVAANPAFDHVGVAQASFVRGDSFDRVGDLSAYADFSNSHNYYIWGKQPGVWVRDRIVEAQKVSPGKAPIATEAGYHNATAVTEWGEGITYDAHAKYMPRLLLENFTQGYERTYVYELFDLFSNAAKDEVEHNWGLFFNDGTPKPAAVGLADFIDLLDDDGSDSLTFKTVPLPYTLSGMPGSAEDLLLQKANGTYALVLWNDVDNWDEEADRPRAQPDAHVRLDLGVEAASVSIYRPVSDGTAPIATYKNVQDIALDLPDHPLIVEIEPPLEKRLYR